MAKKKKRTSLPRVTVLAMNRRDLAAFVGAVEVLKTLAEDLRLFVNRLPKPKPKPAAPAPTPANGKAVTSGAE